MLAGRPVVSKGHTARSSAVRSPAVSRTSVRVQAVFWLFGKAPSASPAKAAQLAEELLDKVSARAPAADVTDLVKQLQPLGVKAPVRSKQLFGEYKLVYSTKAGAQLGARQILEEPDVIREVTTGKSLGVLSTTTTLSGVLNGIDNSTYEEAYERVETKGPLSSEARDVELVREVSVLYLDDNLRITSVNDGKDEGVLYIYQRVGSEQDEAEEDDEPAPRRASPSLPAFFGSPPRESNATIAEREVRQKLAAEEARSKPRLPALPSLPGTVKGTAVLPKPGTVKAGKPGTTGSSGAAAVEAKRKEAEAAAATKAKDAAAAKERQAAIKALVDDLTGDLKEAQAEAREAAKEVKDLERANAVVLKKVASARLQLRSAAEDVEDVAQDIAKQQEARAAAEAALKEALSGLNAAKSALNALTRR